VSLVADYTRAEVTAVARALHTADGTPHKHDPRVPWEKLTSRPAGALITEALAAMETLRELGWAPHYTSTYCIDERHGDCRRVCTNCGKPCRCACHERGAE
jgi:hypothetical protein